MELWVILVLAIFLGLMLWELGLRLLQWTEEKISGEDEPSSDDLSSLQNLMQQLEHDKTQKIFFLLDDLEDYEIDEEFRDHCFDIDEENDFIRGITNLPIDVPITLIIHSDGGCIVSSDAIVRVIQERGNIRSLVPFKAYSAAALIAIACPTIVMGPFALLSPYDPQLEFKQRGIRDMSFSSRHLMQLPDETNETAMMHRLDAKIFHQENMEMTQQMLKGRYSEEVIAQVNEELCSGKHSHSKPFHRSDLVGLGLNIQSVGELPEGMDWVTLGNLLLTYLKGIKEDDSDSTPSTPSLSKIIKTTRQRKILTRKRSILRKKQITN